MLADRARALGVDVARLRLRRREAQPLLHEAELEVARVLIRVAVRHVRVEYAHRRAVQPDAHRDGAFIPQHAEDPRPGSVGAQPLARVHVVLAHVEQQQYADELVRRELDVRPRAVRHGERGADARLPLGRALRELALRAGADVLRAEVDRFLQRRLQITDGRIEFKSETETRRTVVRWRRTYVSSATCRPTT